VVRPDAISRQLPVVRDSSRTVAVQCSSQEFSTVIGSRQPRKIISEDEELNCEL
jgi:hypothetical protein